MTRPSELLAAIPGRTIDFALEVEHDGRTGPGARFGVGQVRDQQSRGLAGARRRDGGERPLDGDAHRASGLRVDAEFETARHCGTFGIAGEAGRAEGAGSVTLRARKLRREAQQDPEGEWREDDEGREGPASVGEGWRSLQDDIAIGRGDLAETREACEVAEPRLRRQDVGRPSPWIQPMLDRKGRRKS